MYSKIKGLLEDDSLFYGLLILLVGVVSFGLGRWSAVEVSRDTQASAVTMTHMAPEIVDLTDSETVQDESEKKFVASKNGSKYHFPWCSGAKQMKEDNKIWFSSKIAAEAAGYSPAANCPGL